MVYHASGTVWVVSNSRQVGGRVMHVYLAIVLHRKSVQCIIYSIDPFKKRGRRGRNSMVVGFTTTYVISAYQH